MDPQFDKFTSGSHSAKNAAGVTRKQITNLTFEHVRSKFSFDGTKITLNIDIQDNAGKCLGTRAITVNGGKLNLPVYEKDTKEAAEFAMAYVAGSSSADEVLAVIKQHLAKMTIAELRAWRAYGGHVREVRNKVFKAKRPHHWKKLEPVIVQMELAANALIHHFYNSTT